MCGHNLYRKFLHIRGTRVFLLFFLLFFYLFFYLLFYYVIFSSLHLSFLFLYEINYMSFHILGPEWLIVHFAISTSPHPLRNSHFTSSDSPHSFHRTHLATLTSSHPLHHNHFINSLSSHH